MQSKPFDNLEKVLDRISRQVEEGMLEGTGFPVPGTVAVDVVETDEAYIVTADLPGYDHDEIEVTLHERTLELEAEREVDVEENVERYLRRERRRQSVSRRLTLPEAVDEEGVTASYEDGVLTVELPKRFDDDESRQIDIE